MPRGDARQSRAGQPMAVSRDAPRHAHSASAGRMSSRGPAPMPHLHPGAGNCPQSVTHPSLHLASQRTSKSQPEFLPILTAPPSPVRTPLSL